MKTGKISRRSAFAMATILGLLSTGALFQNCSQQKFSSTASKIKTTDTSQGIPVLQTDSTPAEIAVDNQAVATVVTTPVVVVDPPVPVMVTPPVVAAPPTPPPVAICAAFDSNQSSVATEGLKAELRYLNPQLAMTTAARGAILSTEYFNDQDSRFIRVTEPIYFSDVNVPSRNFDQGFTTSKGVVMRDNQGSILQEYFALKMETELRLGANDQVGFYELATVSDDGTVVEIMQNGAWSTLISNDGGHNTKMGCGANKIYFDRQTRIPMRMFYNQGPKVTIANVFFKNYRGAKPVTDLLLPSDALAHLQCSVSSQDGFWDSVTSQPGNLFTQISAAGWKPLMSDNFQLKNNQINPCAGQ